MKSLETIPLYSFFYRCFSFFLIYILHTAINFFDKQRFCFKLSDAPKVESLQPFTKDDLARRGMIDLFFDLDNLLQLYPSTAGGGNIPKVMLNQLRQKNEERNHFTKNEILNLGSYKYIL